MSNLNRRGPNDEGAMSGRKLGRCNPENKDKSEEEILLNSTTSNQPGQGQGQGKGQGQGNGGGWRGGRGLGKILRLGRGLGRRLRGND